VCCVVLRCMPHFELFQYTSQTRIDCWHAVDNEMIDVLNTRSAGSLCSCILYTRYIMTCFVPLSKQCTSPVRSFVRPSVPDTCTITTHRNFTLVDGFPIRTSPLRWQCLYLGAITSVRPLPLPLTVAISHTCWPKEADSTFKATVVYKVVLALVACP